MGLCEAAQGAQGSTERDKTEHEFKCSGLCVCSCISRVSSTLRTMPGVFLQRDRSSASAASTRALKQQRSPHKNTLARPHSLQQTSRR